MNELMIAGATLRMTTREIAVLTGMRHDNVLRTARSLAEKGITQSEETHYVSAQNRQSYPEHSLDKRDSLVLVATLSPAFTGRIVDRWLELEAQVAPQLPATYADALRLAADQADCLTAAAPKIAFAEAICNSNGVCKIGEFAKTIGWGPIKFFDRLRADEVLMQNRQPFQKYIDRDYFRVVEKAPWKDSAGNEHPSFTTMVTGRGQQWLAQRYANPVRKSA
jgi:anti-repressor protein